MTVRRASGQGHSRNAVWSWLGKSLCVFVYFLTSRLLLWIQWPTAPSTVPTFGTQHQCGTCCAQYSRLRFADLLKSIFLICTQNKHSHCNLCNSKKHHFLCVYPPRWASLGREDYWMLLIDDKSMRHVKVDETERIILHHDIGRSSIIVAKPNQMNIVAKPNQRLRALIPTSEKNAFRMAALVFHFILKES